MHSYAENLLSRAADVCLKERRKLVLVVRETPLHKGHLEMMARAADLGALILPPMPAFYHKPQTIEDIVDQTIGKQGGRVYQSVDCEPERVFYSHTPL